MKPVMETVDMNVERVLRHQENGCQLFFDMYFSRLFFAYLTLYSHFGTPTFLDSRHSFYKYVLLTYLQLFYNFFTKRTKKA